MGFLLPGNRDDSRDQTAPENVLGLPSRYQMPKDVRQARDREAARSIARTQVTELDILGIARATEVGIVSGSNITATAAAAVRRHSFDAEAAMAIADAGKAAIMRRIQDMGGALG